MAFWPVRLASTSMRSPGLVATQMLTFLFVGIEGSAVMTRRTRDAYAGVLADHHRLQRVGLAALGSGEVVTRGDDLSAVNASPRACADAAIGVQRALVSHAWPAGEPVPARMGIDPGEASRTAAGLGAQRASRIAAVAHEGQLLVSAAVGLLAGSLPAGVWLKDLGLHRRTDRNRAGRIFPLQSGGLAAAFAPPRSLEGARQC